MELLKTLAEHQQLIPLVEKVSIGLLKPKPFARIVANFSIASIQLSNPQWKLM